MPEGGASLGRRSNADPAADSPGNNRMPRTVNVAATAPSAAQPTTSTVERAIGTRLRRKLSSTFQRDNGEMQLACVRPRLVGTRCVSQGVSCQSPRIQRWRRVMSAAYVDGKSSNSVMSLTSAERAYAPSSRS